VDYPSLVMAIGEDTNSGIDYWNEILDWTTGMLF